MKKLLSTAILLCIGLSGISQEWYEYPQKIESVNAINEQSIAIDPDNGDKYSFYLDANNMAILKKYNSVSQEWDEITNSFNLIGTSIPMYLTVMAKAGEVVLGFYDQGAQLYYVFYDIGGGFFQVGTPIFCMDGLDHAKMVYNGSFNNSYLLRYVTGDGEDIQVDHIDVPSATNEDYGFLPIPGGPSSQPSKPDIHVGDTEIWVIHEYYSSGAGNDECLVQKCPIGSPYSWTTHAGIGLNLDNFTIFGTPGDFPYIAYEDFDNTQIKLDKMSAASFDNISQMPIAPVGIETLKLTGNNAGEIFIGFKNNADNKLWIMKDDGGGGFSTFGTGNYANYADVSAFDFTYFEPFNNLNIGFGVPPGPDQGGYFAKTNELPTYSATIKSHCNNVNASDTLLLFTTTDVNKDSVYVISATSSDQGVISDAEITFTNVAHSFNQSIRNTLINVNNVGNSGTTNITVTYTDGIDTISNNVAYTVNADPTIFLSIPSMDTCVNTASFDLNNYVAPTGGTWVGGNIFDPTAQGVGTHNIDYTYTDGNGCSATVTQVININGLPTITFTTDPVDICEGEPSHDLTPYATPSGGTFIEGNSFDPVAEGVGNHIRTYQYTDGNGCTNTNTLNVDVHQLPTITLLNTPVEVCINDDLVDLTPFVMENDGAFSPNDSFDPGTYGLGTHVFTYTRTDAYGCMNSENFNVEVNDVPLIDFNSASVQLCSNADVYDLYQNINGGLPGVFTNTEDNFFDPVLYPEGSVNYVFYKVTDPTSGCSNEASFEIELLTIPDVTSNVTPSNCGSNDGAVDLTISTANGPTTIYWSNGSLTEDLTSLSPGVYYANVTDINGCVSVLPVDVQSNEINLSATITDASCYGANDGSIDLTPTGNGPFLFLWATADSTEDISNVSAGTYFVTVTDDNGCVSTANYYVGQPEKLEFEATVTPSNCPNADGSIAISSETGGDGSFNYNWIGTTGSNPVNGLANGPYTFWLSDGNGCTSDTAYLNVSGSGAPELFATVTNSDCNLDNGAIDLTIGGNPADIASISWSNSESTEDISNLAPGIYTVTVENTSGCTSTLTKNVKIAKPLQNDLCVVTVDSATTTNLVVWERIQTSGIEHYNIYRENAIAGEYIKIDEVHADSLSQYVDLAASPEVRSWRYKLSATNECGVEGPQSMHHKTIHIVYSDNGSGEYNISWDQYEGFTYGTYFIDRRDAINTEWTEVGQVSVGNPLNLTDTPPTITGLDYRVSVVTPGQCTATKANDYNSSRSNRSAGIFTPGDTDTIPDVGLTELELNYNVDIFPNPSTGILNIATDEFAQITGIEIKAINGTTIMNDQVSGNLITTDVSTIENGIYFIIVHTTEGKSLHKFIKQ